MDFFKIKVSFAILFTTDEFEYFYIESISYSLFLCVIAKGNVKKGVVVRTTSGARESEARPHLLVKKTATFLLLFDSDAFLQKVVVVPFSLPRD